MMMRSRQQEEERCQFRKACRRRATAETQKQSGNAVKGNANEPYKLGRLQRYGYLASSPAATESTAVACRG